MKQKQKEKEIYGIAVRPDGRFRSIYKGGRWLRGALDSVGYHQVRRDNTHRIHRLVGILFVPRYSPILNIIDHKDGDKENNRASNLRWVTKSLNGLNRQGLVYTPSLVEHVYSKRYRRLITLRRPSYVGKVAGLSVGSFATADECREIQHAVREILFYAKYLSHVPTNRHEEAKARGDCYIHGPDSLAAAVDLVDSRASRSRCLRQTITRVHDMCNAAFWRIPAASHATRNSSYVI